MYSLWTLISSIVVTLIQIWFRHLPYKRDFLNLNKSVNNKLPWWKHQFFYNWLYPTQSDKNMRKNLCLLFRRLQAIQSDVFLCIFSSNITTELDMDLNSQYQYLNYIIYFRLSRHFILSFYLVLIFLKQIYRQSSVKNTLS